jgi:hypothetical protein
VTMVGGWMALRRRTPVGAHDAGGGGGRGGGEPETSSHLPPPDPAEAASDDPASLPRMRTVFKWRSAARNACRRRYLKGDTRAQTRGDFSRTGERSTGEGAGGKALAAVSLLLRTG